MCTAYTHVRVDPEYGSRPILVGKATVTSILRNWLKKVITIHLRVTVCTAYTHFRVDPEYGSRSILVGKATIISILRNWQKKVITITWDINSSTTSNCSYASKLKESQIHKQHTQATCHYERFRKI